MPAIKHTSCVALDLSMIKGTCILLGRRLLDRRHPTITLPSQTCILLGRLLDRRHPTITPYIDKKHILLQHMTACVRVR